MQAQQHFEPITSDESQLIAERDATEKALQAARTSQQEAETHRDQLIAKQAEINRAITDVQREQVTASKTASKAVIAVIGDRRKFHAAIADAAKERVARDQAATVLLGALTYLTDEEIPQAEVRVTEAAIGVVKASLDWVTAAGRLDAFKTQTLLGHALAHDPGLSVNVSENSHAAVFAQKINALELDLAALNDKLRKQQDIARRKI